MTERTNEQWLASLSRHGIDRNAAIEDLRKYLVRGLGYALAKYSNVRPDDVEDFAQEATLRILNSLDTFRGESRFLTWAQKIAVRVALSELRRARWHDVPLQQPESGDFVPDALVSTDAGPEDLALQRSVLEAVRDTIRRDLTDRQRQAMIAVLVQGMSPQVVAERMGTNRNALYKLLHDARRRLQSRLSERGLDPEAILSTFARVVGQRTPTTTRLSHGGGSP